MSSTYSSGYTFPIQTDKLSDILSVLQKIPDNFNNEIDPKDVRDGIFTNWENIIYKPTTIPSSDIEYVGIDKDSFVEKILIGPKKKPDGTYVLDDNLLSLGDGDIFFYTSKTSSTATDLSTKLVLLAGTGSYYWSGEIVAPFIESKVVDNGSIGYSLDLDIINKSYVSDSGVPTFSGHVNIESENGTVYINELRLPTTSQNSSATDNQVLTFRKTSGPTPIYFAEWKDATASVAPATVYFTDLNEVPETIGGIVQGSTFSEVLIEDMMRRLLYPYISPIISLTIDPVVEFNQGVVGGVTQSYSLSVQTISTYSATFNLVPGTTITTPSFIIPTNTTSATYGILSMPSISAISTSDYKSYKTSSYTMSVSDTSGNSVTYSFVMNTSLPFYYGTMDTPYTASIPLTILSKTQSTIYNNLLTPKLSIPVLTQSSIYNITVPLSTPSGSSKYIYFGYPYDLPPLVEIRDSNGFEVTGNFKTYSIGNIQSPYGSTKWSSRTYSFYIYVGPLGVSPTTSTIGDLSGGWTENYQFNFGTAS